MGSTVRERARKNRHLRRACKGCARPVKRPGLFTASAARGASEGVLSVAKLYSRDCAASFQRLELCRNWSATVARINEKSRRAKFAFQRLAEVLLSRSFVGKSCGGQPELSCVADRAQAFRHCGAEQINTSREYPHRLEGRFGRSPVLS